MYSAYTGVPYKGRIYDMQDVLTGLATGVKPYDVDVNKNIDFLINDYTKIRSKAYQASDLYDTDTNNENGDIEKEFINIQRNIWREQRRIYNAFKTAKHFGVTNSTLRNELRARGISWSDVQKILSGKFDPIPYNKTRFLNKLKDLKEMDKDKGFDKKRTINKRSFNPKTELDRILRFLRNQRLDEEFKYDIVKEPQLEIKDQTRLEVPDKTLTAQAPQTNIKTPPNIPVDTAEVSEEVVKTAAVPSNVNQNTGLTHVEEALLSNEEKAMRLRQRGMTA